jgi:cellulose synthase (UDP-forming)
MQVSNPWRTEIRLTVVAICVVITSTVLFIFNVGLVGLAALRHDHVIDLALAVVFTAIMLAFLYSEFAYFFSRIGSLMRQAEHATERTDQLLSIYDRDPPSLTVLVPSYKEEELVVSRALLSAALAEYPNKRIVLLIDDAPNPKTDADARALAHMRQLPKQLRTLFAPVSREFREELSAYSRRQESGSPDVPQEAERLGELYERAANWLERHADQWLIRDHIDSFFVERVFRNPARRHRVRADGLRATQSSSGVDHLREYRRLAGLFDAEFSSFERKRFVNLSHEANKAMNLNSYLGLMGRSWRFSYRDNNQYLEPSTEKHADLSLPDSTYVVTLDADSILLNDYTLRLVNVMEAPGNEQLAVAQTPYSAFPGATNLLERIAGATTDIQYFVHQGFTHFKGTYWVGANALIRRQALDDLAVQRSERGFPVTVYVQDRTVIEDTESSIDLVVKGWSLYNYPSRLAYSATPADFGSLLIQRRRWANGGLIILPKLLRHILAESRQTNFAEGFLRIHYLISLATTSTAMLLLLLLPFEQGLCSIWLPLAAAPYFLLYGRDLVRAGYSWKDLLGVYALNLLLIPVHLGGVLRSLQQAITGRKTPFGRTPKVATRTAAPSLYIWAITCLLFLAIISTLIGLADGQWVRFLFSLVNTIAFSFVILNFIGPRKWVEDAFARPQLGKIAYSSSCAPDRLGNGVLVEGRDEYIYHGSPIFRGWDDAGANASHE